MTQGWGIPKSEKSKKYFLSYSGQGSSLEESRRLTSRILFERDTLGLSQLDILTKRWAVWTLCVTCWSNESCDPAPWTGYTKFMPSFYMLRIHYCLVIFHAHDTANILNSMQAVFFYFSALDLSCQWFQSLFRCRIATLNFSMGFNIVAPYMDCVTHK